jgi:CheY-like chemotaxis protein
VAGSTTRKPGRPLLGLRLMIVEDTWLVADMLSVKLEEAGAQVQGPFPTGARAIECLRDGAMDFALVDLNLSDGFADDLVDALVEKNIPYAILTGYRALPTNADERAVAVLKKPFDPVELIDLLTRHVRSVPDDGT